MKKIPIIGIIPLIDYSKDSYWMVPGYVNGLKQAGALPVILPTIKTDTEAEMLADMCDGFLFTGGQDVDPAIYSEKKSELCGECCPERDVMEKLLLETSMKRNKPILGICRGIQFINAVLGGTLWQDIPKQFSDKLTHCQKPPYDIPVHDVSILNDTPLYELLKKECISVNSYHHQGVRELSPKLKCMARSPDGLIEAVYSPEYKFLWAVQWHPEFSYEKDENSLLIFKEFVSCCSA
ncbi:gamma-glutamyl-gamma-aminobutyrate hydrolase family protein [Ruminococcus albus]|uniref:Putative glutamine amidotransferase n=1 Tax=Ruminococcus albus TaxID=1264 RepID=A0A1I1PX98_RUMAL|nr:gamma-glutamyl-gamma-aminobutyrate hydrolase family protein [Ruminococcus albus]SFD11613.1 putative glutamine amidotransferase [Ruminococcus albus]